MWVFRSLRWENNFFTGLQGVAAIDLQGSDYIANPSEYKQGKCLAAEGCGAILWGRPERIFSVEDRSEKYKKYAL